MPLAHLPEYIYNCFVNGVHTEHSPGKLINHPVAREAVPHSSSMINSVALLSGIVVGVALAVPLGAIGLLLIQEGVARGMRRGFPAAAAVSLVDIMYCAVAVAAGSLVGPIISNWVPWPQVIGGVTLIALGVLRLIGRPRPKVSSSDGTAAHSGATVHRFVLFLGLTAINPATVVYFASILPGLDQISASTAARVSFVIGVGLASAGWQTLLVALGAILRHKAGPALQKWTVAVGNGLVVVLGAVLIIRSL